MAYVIKAIFINSYKIEYFNTGMVALYHTEEIDNNNNWDFTKVPAYDFCFMTKKGFKKFIKNF